MQRKAAKDIAMVIALSVVLTSTAWSAGHAPAPKKAAKPAKAAKSATIDMTQAKALFSQSCSPCHGEDASGGEGPDIRKKGFSAVLISDTVHNGIKGQMPAFGQQFTKPQEDAVVQYIRSLQ